MKKIILTTLIILITQILFTSSSLAFGRQSSSISGMVWLDTNSNNVQELNEESAANIKVFAQNRETQEITETQTNYSGSFVISDLPYGLYNVWCEEHGGLKADPYFIEIREVVGTDETVNLGLKNSKFAPSEEPEELTPGFSKQGTFTIFLPIVNN